METSRKKLFSKHVDRVAAVIGPPTDEQFAALWESFGRKSNPVNTERVASQIISRFEIDRVATPWTAHAWWDISRHLGQKRRARRAQQASEAGPCRTCGDTGIVSCELLNSTTADIRDAVMNCPECRRTPWMDTVSIIKGWKTRSKTEAQPSAPSSPSADPNRCFDHILKDIYLAFPPLELARRWADSDDSVLRERGIRWIEFHSLSDEQKHALIREADRRCPANIRNLPNAYRIFVSSTALLILHNEGVPPSDARSVEW